MLSTSVPPALLSNPKSNKDTGIISNNSNVTIPKSLNAANNIQDDG